MNLCKCGCGQKTSMSRVSRLGLVAGKSFNRYIKGHRNKGKILRAKADDLIGKKIGRLTVIERVPRPTNRQRGPAYVRALCECGAETIAEARRVRDGHTASCGCTRREGEEALFQRVWNNYRSSARKRGHEITLTREDVRRITSLPCYYCNRENSYGLQTSRGLYRHKHNGIDRINNTKGYTLANSCPCCFRCNQAKSTMTQKEFLAWIKSVYEVHFVTF